MFSYHSGNIFDSTAEALVNPVNCVGVMGLGLALQFKIRHHDNFLAYQKECKLKKVKVGRMFVYAKATRRPSHIINFPTKIHWKDSSNLSYINEGLDDLRMVILAMNLKSIAIPRIGCGLGGLPWIVVHDMIVNKLQDLHDVDIQIYT